ncbi:hypothetical protein PLESTM_000150600 [Pleodorina starrii]|nr:hypothetical protein PLESTM_000150600 [Pleodorina starrii]
MHLVVIQHGLWGFPANTAHLSLLLRERLGHGYFILNSDVNSGNLTYDGIDVCGDRLFALIQKTIASIAATGTSVSAISLIGYSMGGLVIRYVAGKLYAEGVFTHIVPVNFITVATPHLGAWRMPSSWYNRAFNFMVPVVTSRSGYQLVLQDKHVWGKPLLCLMSHPDLLFMRALRCFKQLMLMANVFHDRPVPYCTAAIRLDNPYEKNPPVPIDPKYPSIGGVAAAATTAVRAVAAIGAAAADAPTPAEDPPESAEPSPSAQQPQPLPPLRPLRSTYLPLLMLVFLPLALPALLLMVITGKTHHSKITRTALDFSWIQSHHHNHPPLPGQRQQQGQDAAATQQRGMAQLPAAAATGGCGSGGEDVEEQRRSAAAEDALPSDIDCPSAPELPTRRSTSKSLTQALPAAAAAPPPLAAASGSGDGGIVTAAPASSTALGAMDDGADGVVVSEQSVLLHDGIVELPAEVHRVQEWLVEKLNQLPWRKVDVDCRDLHAHAAIIMRNPGRFSHNRDVLDYLTDQFLRT